jgi:hypothetical protein
VAEIDSPVPLKGDRVLRTIQRFAALTFFSLMLAACGGGEKEGNGEVSKEAEAACNGSALTQAPNLPKGWPDLAEVTYTQQSVQGPTTVVDGYFEGDLESAHDAFKTELEASGFTILFDEIEEDDSEVSWKGEGRSGQVALRDDCGDSDKMFVHVTNRPA